jgi:hypothetical protein
MVGEYALSSAHNSSLAPKVVISFCLFYFVTQQVSVAPNVYATKQVIQNDGFTSSSSPITRARGARTLMQQSFLPLNTEEEHTLLARGEETTTPQVLGHQILMSHEYIYIRKTHNFPLISLWNANFKCVKWFKNF